MCPGYSIGQHRRQPGKQCAFEEDVNIPLIVRGPGVREGAVTDRVTSHTDLAPTFLALARASLPSKFELDGQAIPLRDPEPLHPTSDEASLVPDEHPSRQEHINVEMWGIIMSEGKYGSILYPNHTYKALRVVGESYNFLYTVWCNGDHELYNVETDPYQLKNLFESDLLHPTDLSTAFEAHVSVDSSVSLTEQMFSINTTSLPSSGLREDGQPDAATLARLVNRLDALLMVLKSCKGRQCSHPWETLFPAALVKNLADSMDTAYDEFFVSKVAKVRYERCEKGYIAKSEGPMWSNEQAYGMEQEVSY